MKSHEVLQQAMNAGFRLRSVDGVYIVSRNGEDVAIAGSLEAVNVFISGWETCKAMEATR